jgi:hypothetical protein
MGCLEGEPRVWREGEMEGVVLGGMRAPFSSLDNEDDK